MRDNFTYIGTRQELDGTLSFDLNKSLSSADVIESVKRISRKVLLEPFNTDNINIEIAWSSRHNGLDYLMLGVEGTIYVYESKPTWEHY